MNLFNPANGVRPFTIRLSNSLSYNKIDKEAIYKMKNELEECLLIQIEKLFLINDM